MQQALTDKVKLIVTDSKLAFMQGRYEESLRLAKQALDIDRKNILIHCLRQVNYNGKKISF